MATRRKIPDDMRQQVSVAARYRCSYCQAPQIAGVPMVIEHIVPLSAGGTNDRSKLCLACYRCNEFKGIKTRNLDPLSGETVRLFNPYTQAWSEHFLWRDNSLWIEGRTACGRATIDALRLNNEWQVRARQIWMLAGIHPPLD